MWCCWLQLIVICCGCCYCDVCVGNNWRLTIISEKYQLYFIAKLDIFRFDKALNMLNKLHHVVHQILKETDFSVHIIGI